MESNLRRRTILTVCALLLAAGCASSGAGGPRTDPDLLTAEQLQPYLHLNAYDAIRTTRPQWLRNSRGTSSMVEATASQRGLRVYVDGLLFGMAEDLQRVEVRAIHDIRFLDSREATLQFGTNHAEGALVIRTAG